MKFSISADAEDYYDDDENKSEPNNYKEDNNVNRAVLTRNEVHITAKLGDNVTLLCDVEGLGGKCGNFCSADKITDIH